MEYKDNIILHYFIWDTYLPLDPKLSLLYIKFSLAIDRQKNNIAMTP